MFWGIIKHAWRPVVEITILTIAIYYAFIFVRGTRGWPVVIGFLVMLALTFVSTYLELAPANFFCIFRGRGTRHISARVPADAW